jgi:hypothetical protein
MIESSTRNISMQPCLPNNQVNPEIMQIKVQTMRRKEYNPESGYPG